MEYVKKPLMNSKEADFLKKLQDGLKPLQVFPQVSMNAVLNVKFQKSFKDRIPFTSKIIDYVVCIPKTFDIVSVIEFDSAWHDSPERKKKDKERDKLMESAGYIVIRYDWRDMPSSEKLKNDFRRILVKYHIFKGISPSELEKRIARLHDDL